MALLDTALSVGTGMLTMSCLIPGFPTRRRSQPFHAKGMDVIAHDQEEQPDQVLLRCDEQLSIKEIYSREQKSAVADQNICCLLMPWREKETPIPAKDRMRKEQSQPQGLAGIYLYGYDSF